MWPWKEDNDWLNKPGASLAPQIILHSSLNGKSHVSFWCAGVMKMEEQLVCNHQCIFAKHKNLFHVSGVVKQTFELLRGPTQGLMSRFSQRSGPASGQSSMKRRQFIPRNPEAALQSRRHFATQLSGSLSTCVSREYWLMELVCIEEGSIKSNDRWPWERHSLWQSPVLRDKLQRCVSLSSEHSVIQVHSSEPARVFFRTKVIQEEYWMKAVVWPLCN